MALIIQQLNDPFLIQNMIIDATLALQYVDIIKSNLNVGDRLWIDEELINSDYYFNAILLKS